MWRFWLAITLLVALGACSGSNEYFLDKELYDRSCAACHGVSGEGIIGPAIDSGSNTDLNLSDEQIAGVITVGPGNMPGFSRFTAEQVQSLVGYTRSLGG